MWVARDKNGSLWIYRHKPIKKSKFGSWMDTVDDDCSPIHIWRDIFPEVQWEDEEPRELTLK